MKKDDLHAIKEALICLLNLHLTRQTSWFKDKELAKWRDNYIAKTIQLLEEPDKDK